METAPAFPIGMGAEGLRLRGENYRTTVGARDNVATASFLQRSRPAGSDLTLVSLRGGHLRRRQLLEIDRVAEAASAGAAGDDEAGVVAGADPA